ncbi:4-(cytidine 5'-diphospho)-2-C-methyl-D-erythritol kinase [Candidatus Nitrosacidococcus sp. I8]|uniref:4-(cytidine 5'-diphospho)-2-C-methyl-D-erythritol kinase n=1 Tax=Candidatus Nitrosacidococcus sp. I8 TaxID=2942908 RepID=UPI00222620B6|nr:4-(cytidine 5'-diphospho)-2-C-methyl-D-erythritol kinase [Candidatus Nitrosacidococcus sp. I8]CAH9019899.1 4-diphosphocytidyl-2-C-methyl-D-erythritol kinase [Candidatus Nitrosacidococcus sp. I8]
MFFTYPAPAKLNLFLHITGRRSDGYHLLQTAFQFIGYCDWLTFKLSPNKNIVYTPLANIPKEKDLVYRAALLLQKETGYSQGVKLSLYKNLPMGGGLGGGSSDAATVLVALNDLWKTNLSIAELSELGLRLGADVPIFIYGHAAWAEGVGEKLVSINPKEAWYLLVIPPAQVSTKEVFSSDELKRNCESITIADYMEGKGENVLEPIVCQRYPIIGEIIYWLSQFTLTRMTGTGSSIFGLFDTKQEALEVLKKMPTLWKGIITKGYNESLLQDYLSKNRILK